MSIYTAIAVYFVIWWVSLFLVLPWGAHSQSDEGQIVPGSEPGAPTLPRVANKLMWTTVVAAVIFAVGYFLYTVVGFSVIDRLLP